MPPAKEQPWILYVDDEAANRVIFERSFEREFSIRTAETAEQGLEILSEIKVGVLLTDQRLPGMLGTELLAIAKEKHPHTVRMVLTAYSELEVVLKAINEGLASRYILKPWLRPMLQEILTWGCDMHRMQVQIEEMQLKLIEGERLSTMGTLLASVAHDIKNPLGYVGAYVETLGDAVESLQAWVSAMRSEGSYAAAFRLPQAAAALNEIEELPRVVKDLTQGVNHVYSIVEGIQLQSRRPGRNRVAADPAVSLEYGTKLVKGMISARGGTLVVDAGALPRVLLSTAELSQVLVNLLTNAAHALDNINGQREVRISAKSLEGGVEFRISDTGSGMPADVMARAFEQFFTTKPQGSGTGLGLAISRRLVESVGGRIDLTSEMGRGTTVTFWIPESAALNPGS